MIKHPESILVRLPVALLLCAVVAASGPWLHAEDSPLAERVCFFSSLDSDAALTSQVQSEKDACCKKHESAASFKKKDEPSSTQGKCPLPCDDKSSCCPCCKVVISHVSWFVSAAQSLPVASAKAITQTMWQADYFESNWVLRLLRPPSV